MLMGVGMSATIILMVLGLLYPCHRVTIPGISGVIMSDYVEKEGLQLNLLSLPINKEAGTFVGVGNLGYSFVSVQVENGQLSHLTILDHDSIQRFYTISEIGNHLDMTNQEIYYFLIRFFEWKKI